MYAGKCADFKYKNLHLKEQKHAGKKPIRYVSEPAAFDIETTNIDKYRQAIMYIWQFQIGQWTIYGRTWEEFKEFKKNMEACLPQDCWLVVYVHNLSFEFQFLKSIIDIQDVFAMDDRKVLRIRSGRFEFRCSYIHSNMSLDQFLKKMDVKNKKIKGFDYRKKRYPWTRLSKNELLYCFNDVRGLTQAIKKEMQNDGDNLYTIPLTATGYSRRLAKEALGGYRRYIKDMLPDLETFHALRKAFRGGNTHANRYNANIIIKATPDVPIMSYDRSSSYPAEMLTGLYPKKFIKKPPDMFDSEYKHGKACLMHIYIEDLKLQDIRYGAPYIPKAKCEHISGGLYDNGRVLEAQSLDMYITEIDFEIILNEYEFRYDVLELWTATKAPLPQKFKELLLKTYAEKTLLKGQDEYLYTKKKNLFNSYYGMMVQNPCKPNYEYAGGVLKLKDESLEDLIEKYQNTGWLPYQWGVYCTCYARQKLETALQSIPYDDLIYLDTDSCKFIGNHSDIFEKLNRQFINEDLKAPDREGKMHYLGIFEKDAEYIRFKTMGAKKYAYDDKTGLHVTISGVAKKAGAEELKKLENFKEGFIFRKAGGLCSLYNDFPEVSQVRIQGHIVNITSNVALFPSTYTLGLTEEYSRLIRYLMNTDISMSLHYDR